jgi:hypothetical protein
MGVAMNTFGVDTIAQLYGVDTHARSGGEAPGRRPAGARRGRDLPGTAGENHRLARPAMGAAKNP